MEKKRSVGVTIFGWVFIIYGALGLLVTLKPQQYIKIYGVGIFFFGIIMSLATLICGIFILKLKPRAPKVAILLCLISIILSPLFIKPILNELNNEDIFAKRKQMILERLKPEYQQEVLEDFEKAKEATKRILPIVLIVGFGIPFLLLDLIPIYFFTRPKIKEQFK